MSDAVDQMFFDMLEETKAKIHAALDQVSKEEVEFILDTWTTIRMHRDLSLGLNDLAVDVRCIKCASAVYRRAVKKV